MTARNPALVNKACDECGRSIAGKRVRIGRKDGLYRCMECQAVRNRNIRTAYMRDALKGEKAEQYKTIRNRAKLAWEQRNPEGKRARDLIKSVKVRLRAYGHDVSKFVRPSTRALAETIEALPKACIKCMTDSDLTIEHIQPVVDYPELALEPTNLTTLCRPCNTRSYFHE